MEFDMKIISRKEAKANGMKHYFTGNVCIRGHIAERFTCNKTCIECDALRRKARKAVKVKSVVNNVVSTSKQVRMVKFRIVGRDRRYMGRDKFNCDIIEDKIIVAG
jgi:hypothetical protein